jgi:hypothetical protein
MASLPGRPPAYDARDFPARIATFAHSSRQREGDDESCPLERFPRLDTSWPDDLSRKRPAFDGESQIMRRAEQMQVVGQ